MVSQASDLPFSPSSVRARPLADIARSCRSICCSSLYVFEISFLPAHVLIATHLSSCSYCCCPVQDAPAVLAARSALKERKAVVYHASDLVSSSTSVRAHACILNFFRYIYSIDHMCANRCFMFLLHMLSRMHLLDLLQGARQKEGAAVVPPASDLPVVPAPRSVRAH